MLGSVVMTTLALSWPASAIVMEPTFQAAELLGFQVVGEVEFKKGSVRPQNEQIQKQVEEIGEVCPRTQAFDPNISSFARFVVMAWSDLEYPTRERQFHSAEQQWLAQRRAREVTARLRQHIKGELHFETVNMANRRTHLVQPAVPSDQPPARRDVKQILEIAGAAPSDPLGVGLFAEYAQSRKAVVWVECREALVKRRPHVPALVRLAANGARP